MHNLLRKDRYKPTEYVDEKSQLYIKENGSYTLDSTKGKPLIEKLWQPNDNQLATQDSIGKDSIELDKDSIDIICEVPESDTTLEYKEKVIITFLLNDKTDFEITESVYNQYVELYPNVDVIQELRSIKAWCISNPTKRKTRRGALKFVNSWLERRQNSNNTKSNQTVKVKYEDGSDYGE